MKRVSSDDRISSARADEQDFRQDIEDWAPPVAPLAVPRQRLEAPRPRRDRLQLWGPSPQGS